MKINRWVLVVGACLVVPLLVVLAKGTGLDPTFVASPLIDQPAPEFRLVDLEGEEHVLSEYRGRPVVINFWATYCVPCLIEHPVFMWAKDHYRDRVIFLGVVYQDDPELIRRFLAEKGAWGPSLVDPDGKVAIAYGVFGPPETFFIDSEGVVREKVISNVSGDFLVSVLDRLVEG